MQNKNDTSTEAIGVYAHPQKPITEITLQLAVSTLRCLQDLNDKKNTNRKPNWQIQSSI